MAGPGYHATRTNQNTNTAQQNNHVIMYGPMLCLVGVLCSSSSTRIAILHRIASVFAHSQTICKYFLTHPVVSVVHFILPVYPCISHTT